MTDDLKKLAEAEHEAVFWFDDLIAAWLDREKLASRGMLNALDFDVKRVKDAILNLIRERDEAVRSVDSLRTKGYQDRIRQSAEHGVAIAGWRVRAETAEAALSAAREALETIANLHIPDQPAHFSGDELEWAQRHVSSLRRIATEALTKEPPHA